MAIVDNHIGYNMEREIYCYLIFMYNENAKFLILQSRLSVVFFYTHLKCHILKEYTLDKDTLSTASTL